MYRSGGIGDIFLLTFPAGEGSAHMLIDCGVLKGTDDGKARMQALVTQIGEFTGGRLDVLVVTHEHWDHVSGFVQAPEEFRRLKIGEVWMAWTEKPDDDLAKALRERKAKAREAVTEAVKKLKLAAGPAAETTLKALSSLNQFGGDFGDDAGPFGAAGRPTTAGAMRWAREEASKQVRFLEPGDGPLAVPGVAGVRVFVLGPPRDTTLLKRSDPSQRTPEVYHLAGNLDLGFAAALVKPNGVDEGRPFDASFETPIERAGASEQADFYRQRYAEAEEWRQIEADWLHTAERLALQLDSDTNNTSLALAFELVESGRVLLFPGDAQVGNWLSWESEACTWKLTDLHGGEPVIVKAKDLLARTVLYKVGHHASHNATLREKGLELMTSGELMALIPVYREQALEQGASGWDMPFGPLLTRLMEKTADRVARTDTGVPRAMADCCREEPDYIECTIDL
jgi:hypothetical protein